MNTEEFYRAKAIKQLVQKKEMRFRKNMNLYFIYIPIVCSALILYLILK